MIDGRKHAENEMRPNQKGRERYWVRQQGW
jgi:hypothetical protein